MTRRQALVLPGLAYLIIALTPLALCFTEPARGDGLLGNLAIALGFLGLSVLGLQTATGARLPSLTRRYGREPAGRFHRQITLLAVLATLGHPALLFVVDPANRKLMDLAHAPLRTQLGWLAVAALVVLVLSSIGRRLLRLSYGAWHVLHSLLAVVIVLAALGHALLVDNYLSIPAVRIAWLVYGAVYLWLAVYVRLLRPVLMWRRPWLVTGLHPEPGNSVTVTIQPRSHRHAARTRHRFRAGQFAWLVSGHGPFALAYHPFSISSSAEDKGHLDFTIKRVGSFTGEVRNLRIGDRVYLDGPHGAFTIDRTPGPGFVFLATGAGITPFLSMLATLADRKDKRPCLLLLGNRSEIGITGVRQLHGLANRLNLTVVHVISRPSTAWLGERGRITTSLLRFYLPPDFGGLEYYICASAQPARAYRRSLRELGVPATQIHSEQF